MPRPGYNGTPGYCVVHHMSLNLLYQVWKEVIRSAYEAGYSKSNKYWSSLPAASWMVAQTPHRVVQVEVWSVVSRQVPDSSLPMSGWLEEAHPGVGRGTGSPPGWGGSLGWRRRVAGLGSGMMELKTGDDKNMTSTFFAWLSLYLITILQYHLYMYMYMMALIQEQIEVTIFLQQ